MNGGEMIEARSTGLVRLGRKDQVEANINHVKENKASSGKAETDMELFVYPR